MKFGDRNFIGKIHSVVTFTKYNCNFLHDVEKLHLKFGKQILRAHSKPQIWLTWHKFWLHIESLAFNNTFVKDNIKEQYVRLDIAEIRSNKSEIKKNHRQLENLKRTLVDYPVHTG